MFFFSALIFLYGASCVICCILYKEWWITLSLIPFFIGLIGLIIWCKDKKFSRNAKKFEKQNAYDQKVITYTIEDLKNKILSEIKEGFSSYLLGKENLLSGLTIIPSATVQNKNIYTRNYIPAYSLDKNVKALRFIFGYKCSESKNICSIKLELPQFIDENACEKIDINNYKEITEKGLKLSIDSLYNLCFLENECFVENNDEIFEFISKTISSIKDLLTNKNFIKLLNITQNNI